jgi:uncharacterized protein
MLNKILLNIAPQAINDYFNGRDSIDVNKLLVDYPHLQNPTATFVTLTINGNLRGCIGSLIAHRTLIDDIIHNAKSAAFGDPRFRPLTKEEFQNTKIEISLLTSPQPIEYTNSADLKSKVTKGLDGIILKSGYNQATFLPQVWESLPSFEEFFQALCQKAGLSGNCLENKPQIFKYNVEKIS